MSITFQNWANSDYNCDHILCGNSRSSLAARDEAKKTARLIGLADAVSQLFKTILECILSPIVCLGAIGMSLGIMIGDVFEGTMAEIVDTALFFPAAILFPLRSIVNRIHIIVSELDFAVWNKPKEAAKLRLEAFSEATPSLLMGLQMIYEKLGSASHD